MTIKQRKRRHARRRAHAAGVSRAIGRPVPRPQPLTPSVAAAEVVAELQRENALRLLTVAKLQALATRRGVEYRAKDRKADLIAKIMAAGTPS